MYVNERVFSLLWLTNIWKDFPRHYIYIYIYIYIYNIYRALDVRADGLLMQEVFKHTKNEDSDLDNTYSRRPERLLGPLLKRFFYWSAEVDGPFQCVFVICYDLLTVGWKLNVRNKIFGRVALMLETPDDVDLRATNEDRVFVCEFRQSDSSQLSPPAYTRCTLWPAVFFDTWSRRF